MSKQPPSTSNPLRIFDPTPIYKQPPSPSNDLIDFRKTRDFVTTKSVFLKSTLVWKRTDPQPIFLQCASGPSHTGLWNPQLFVRTLPIHRNSQCLLCLSGIRVWSWVLLPPFCWHPSNKSKSIIINHILCIIICILFNLLCIIILFYIMYLSRFLLEKHQPETLFFRYCYFS